MNIQLQQIRALDMLIRAVIQKTVSVDDFIKQVFTISKQWPVCLKPDYQYAESILITNEAFNSLFNPDLVFYNSAQKNQYVYDYIISKSKRIQSEDVYYQRCEIKNQNKLRDYLAQLLKHYARLLFVRLDFAIKKEYQHVVDIQQFQAYLQVMSNRYSNQDGYFSGLQGYAWAIEEGLDKGLHCHTLLIFDGNKHQNDFGLGLQIAQYWTELTQGKGCCFISNDPEYKKKFIQSDTLGIGMIHRDHPKEVHNALYAAQYLVNPEKELQHLRVRLPRMRTFGAGQFVVKKRRGI